MSDAHKHDRDRSAADGCSDRIPVRDVNFVEEDESHRCLQERRLARFVGVTLANTKPASQAFTKHIVQWMLNFGCAPILGAKKNPR